MTFFYHLRRLPWLVLPMFLGGCLLELPDMKNDDGPRVDPSAVEKAMDWAWGADTFDGSQNKVNDIVGFTKSVQLYGQSPHAIQLEALRVVNVSNQLQDPDGYTYRNVTLAVTRLDLTKENSQAVTKEYPPYPFFERSLSLNTQQFGLKANLTEHQIQATSSDAPYLSIHNYIIYSQACYANANWNPSCHNLSYWETVEDPPPFVKNDPQCRGLSPCQIRVRYVQFDLVSEVEDESRGSLIRQKTLMRMKFSPDVPYLARLLSLCYQGTGKYENQPYVATVCNDVDNFIPGP